MFTILLYSLFFSSFSNAAESEVKIPQIEVTGSASFESLNEDTYIPTQKLSINSERAGTLDSLKWGNTFPTQNYGFPSGASGVNLGGRSINDTQVTTMGVPLNLPQGGGADFSYFPSFLWKEAVISPTVSNSGFSPNAVSGRLEFIPWTRSTLLDNKTIENKSRITASDDHDAQTISGASSNNQYGAIAGAVLGRSEGGAGGLSSYLIQKPGNQILVHLIGAQIKGESPGSTTNPSPRATKDTWRLIPVLESHQDLEHGILLESTLYGDLQELKFTDPDNSSSNSDTHTYQYGIENAVLVGPYTFALSARYIRFSGAAFPDLTEWPLFASATRDFFPSQETSLKLSLNSNYMEKVGVYPGGKLSAKFSSDPHQYFFSEIGEIAKMPTLLDRYAVYGTFYHGNPNLTPERVHLALVGYQTESGSIKSTSTVKAEYRNKIQISSSDYTTMINAGNAKLLSFNEALIAKILPWMSARSESLFTYSKLMDSNLAYPDLPAFSETGALIFSPKESFSLEGTAKYMGPSVTSGGAFHSNYTLFGTALTYDVNKDIQIGAGIENLFDSHAEAIVSYPLEGRLAHFSFRANL